MLSLWMTMGISFSTGEERETVRRLFVTAVALSLPATNRFDLLPWYAGRRSDDHVLTVQHGITSSLRSVGLQVIQLQC
jgi:hypothetical protein